MKKVNYLKTTLASILLVLGFSNAIAQENSLDVKELLGSWKLDLSPENKEDSNFAIMIIDNIGTNLVEGTFYREGVYIQEGRTNTQSGKIYIALISGDNSGTYNTSFFLENGRLYGTTHSLDKDFLAVWVGERM